MYKPCRKSVGESKIFSLLINDLCTNDPYNQKFQLGLITLFTSKADLRGITKDAKNYQIEELVQHVAIRVDEGRSSESALSGNNMNIYLNCI